MPSILDRLRAFAKPTVIQVSLSSDAPTQVLNYTAKSLYQSQDNLKAVVDFLSNSIAQLPLKIYRRDAETERKRDRNSAPALLLWRPNEDQTAFEFIRALAEEYYVFGCVYVWVTPDNLSRSVCGTSSVRVCMLQDLLPRQSWRICVADERIASDIAGAD